MSYTSHAITILFILVFLNGGLAQTVDRGPYLQSLTSNSIIIKWRTDIATNSQVWYGDSPTNLNLMAFSGVIDTTHAIQLTGLSANTIYYYAVGHGNGQLAGATADHYFLTDPGSSASQPVQIWVLGDPGTKSAEQRAVRDAYYNYIGNQHIDAIVLLGDNAYDDGSYSDFDAALFQNMYEDRLINSPLWSAFGNHEGHTADSESQTGPYYDIFTFPVDGGAGGAASGTEAYYSFDYGNIHFISLNSTDIDRSPQGAMMQWLQTDLAATDQDWIVAFFHHPPYTGRHNNVSDFNGKEADMRENALPILEAAGADLVLAGHSHNYERSFLIQNHYGISSTFDPATMALDTGDGRLDGDAPYIKAIGGPNDGKGTIYLVTGSAGQVSTASALNHPVMFHNAVKLGSVAIEVNGLQMDVKFIDDENNIDDYFTIIKQVEPPTVSITSPSDQQYFNSPQTISITADASDSNGSLTEVEFFVDNVSIGVDDSAPYALNWTIPSDGQYRIKAIARDNENNTGSSVVSIQVGATTVCSKILSGNDDAEEKAGGSVKSKSSDLELVFDGSNQTVGMRFVNLNIPQGATILNADIQFTVDETTNGNPCVINIYGEASDDALSFDDSPFNISGRPKTTTTISWSPPDWVTTGASGPAQKTVDISAIIQEIVDRPGFTATSSVSIIMDGTGERTAESFNGSAAGAPELCISFLPYCTDTDSDGTCDAIDECPGGPEPGTACNDGDAGTYNDTVNSNCQCEGIPYDCPLLQADMGDTCDDGDPATHSDVIDATCTCKGVAYDCPSIPANIGDDCDDGDPNTSFDMIDPACQCVGSTLNGEFTTNARISSSSDDAEEKATGSVKTTSSDLELVNDGGNQIIGLRFVNLNIPQGAIISTAHIQFAVDETFNGNPCSLQIYGQAADDPVTFTGNNNNISSRPKTSASVNWSPPDWLVGGEAGANQQTSNIASVIQEIVNRPGYSSSSSLVIIIEGTGERIAESYDGDAGKAPELTVTYDFSCIDSDGDGTCDPDDQCAGGPEPGTACDDGDPNTINDVINTQCQCEGIPPGTSILTCSRINVGSDDAEERPSGSVSTTSSDLELITDNSLVQVVGMRFVNLEIPAGAVINSANIQFTVDEDDNINPCNLQIYGEASDDASTFVKANFNLSSRPKTTSFANWSPQDWINVGDSGSDQQTVDIAAVIQEIVNRPGYSSTSAIVILIEGTGGRTAESFNGDPGKAPELCVDYDVPSQNLQNGGGSSSSNQGETALDKAEFSDQLIHLPNKSSLKVFPNPTVDKLKVALSTSTAGRLPLQIRDLSGRLLLEDERYLREGANEVLINNLILPNGIYILQLFFKDSVYSIKFAILK